MRRYVLETIALLFFSALLPPILAACGRGSAIRANLDGAVEAGMTDLPTLEVAFDTVSVPDAVAFDTASVDVLPVPGTVCPDGIAVLDVCGCGCCGGVPGVTSCYYPALGQTRATIANPAPSPTTCAMAGCALGERHVCCADPGQAASAALYCARDTSSEDLPSLTLRKREESVCTDVVFSNIGAPAFPISSPGLYSVEYAVRGPCDGSGALAIGGLGTMTRDVDATSGLVQISAHLVLFFDAGSGIADSVRFDVAGVVFGACSPGDGGAP